MKTSSNIRRAAVEWTRLDRIVLHLRCLLRDGKVAWHLAGVWREVAHR